MRSWIAHAVVADEAAALTLADALERLEPVGVGAFEIEDGSRSWEVAGYFSEPPDGVALSLLGAAYGGAFIVSLAPERDWAAHVRRQLTPVSVGRFVAHGGHDRHLLTPNRFSLEIEAAMAFGTGHHGSTEGCLRALGWLARQGARPERVADVGCGTAVLAMAAAKQWPARVLASDIDATAVAAARENIRANRVRHRVQAFQSVGMRHARYRQVGKFDLVLANILARPLMRLAPEIAALTRPGGHVVLAGLLERQQAAVEGAYRAWGFARRRVIRLREWTTLVLSR